MPLDCPWRSRAGRITAVSVGGGRGGRGAPAGPPPASMFNVGEKIGIGFGTTFPAVANAIEKFEIVTVTAVGKPGTQAWLSADTKPGDTNIKVSSVANITAGDRIRLGYDTAEHGVEWVTVKNVGTQSAFSPNNARSGETGTGLDLVEPLKFHHSMNTPFSARGTGVSFQPATAFAHSSNEPVMPLGTGISLDKPLDSDHEINVAVRTGTQETPKANQWFGGPAITNAGNIVLRDAAGLVADSLNFGGVIDPWAAEGYQAKSGSQQSGCSAPSPTAAQGGRGGRGGPATATAPAAPTNRSAGRAQDGVDTDSNCTDFVGLSATPGAANQR